jgi:NAD(P)-dependent dehydrogenase (short-subunit alcohol dehydrogenase family)
VSEDSKKASSARKVAVVTGAARGIGKALLDELLLRNYMVVAVVKQLDDVQILNAIDAQSVFAVRADITENSTEKVLQDFLSNTVQKVDLLINNAGFSAKGKGIEGLSFLELDAVMSVHCHGPARCIRSSLPLLKKSKNPVILNISSRFGSTELVVTEAVPNEVTTYPYRIAKSAMNMLTACLAVELRPENIRVLAVHPGAVKTSFAAKDADVEPEQAAKNIIDLAEKGTETGLFAHASGGTLPW